MSLIKNAQKKSGKLKSIKPAVVPVKQFNIIVTPEKVNEFNAWANGVPFGIVNQLIAFFNSCPRVEIKPEEVKN